MPDTNAKIAALGGIIESQSQALVKFGDEWTALRSLLGSGDLEGAVRGLLAKADGYCAEVDRCHEEMISLGQDIAQANKDRAEAIRLTNNAIRERQGAEGRADVLQDALAAERRSAAALKAENAELGTALRAALSREVAVNDALTAVLPVGAPDSPPAAARIQWLGAELKKVKNMARHNYRCAVHEQINVLNYGGKPSPDYPPIMDDEYAALVAESAATRRALEQLVEAVQQTDWVLGNHMVDALVEARLALKGYRTTASFDLLQHLREQREWSTATFGPGERSAGVVDHIRKELAEIESSPLDLEEWIDVVILATDGAWRAGHSPEAIIQALIDKTAKNHSRTWPDWRTAEPGRAIQHVREADKARPRRTN